MPITKQTTSEILWLSVSQVSKLVGVQHKTIRRAIKANKIKYKIVKDRYNIDFFSVIIYMHTNTKLQNKLYQNGIGRYIKEWNAL